MTTLMRRMGIEALYRRPCTTKPEPGHKICSYLLSGMEVTRPNQDRAMDITYLPMAHGFVYLAVVPDWATSCPVVAALSITMEAAFCVETLEDALAHHGRPELVNANQGSQFTGSAFTGLLADYGIAISIDRKGAWRDNVFVERLWRSVKYEGVYLRAYETVGEARSIGRDLDFYNGRRPRSSLDDRTPDKATSIFLRSARRPNPGRRSTYRRGIIVQITGTALLFRKDHSNFLIFILGEMPLSVAVPGPIESRRSPRCHSEASFADLRIGATLRADRPQWKANFVPAGAPP